MARPCCVRSCVCDSSLFQSVHLSCSLGQVTSREEVEWHHYSKGRYTKQFAPEKHVITSERGLVVISIAEEDSGRYDCVQGGQLGSSYHIAVDTYHSQLNPVEISIVCHHLLRLNDKQNCICFTS